MTCQLSQKTCKACSGDVPPLKGEELNKLIDQLDEGWRVVDEHHLQKEYAFDDFRQALDFTNRIGEIAEEQQHHPDIHLAYGSVTIQMWTHKIDGLTESDFVFAAKCDQA